MNKHDAFSSCKSLTDLLRELKRLAVLFPVPGGHYPKFVQAKQDFLDALQDPKYGFDKLPEWAQQDYLDFPEVLDQLVRLKELELEMIGSWLWVSGYTWKYKDQLKELGLQYAPDKKLWYWRPADERSGNSNPIPIELIRQMHGTDANLPPLAAIDQEEKQPEPVPIQTNHFQFKRHDHSKRTPVRSFQRQ